jgi:hypothetical protein
MRQKSEETSDSEDSNMTKEDALAMVISVATEWGENREEGLAGGRVDPDASDDDLKAEYDVDWETAATVRDLWRAIAVLQQPGSRS